MCFLFIPRDELTWFKQIEFGFGEGRQIVEEWRYGLHPECDDQSLDYLMGLQHISDHPEVSHGWVNLGTNFPEESE